MKGEPAWLIQRTSQQGPYSNLLFARAVDEVFELLRLWRRLLRGNLPPATAEFTSATCAK